jgi:hypothetical protein
VATVEDTSLPAFVQADWSSHFIPTLYSSFLASEKPFEHFNKGAVFLGIIQEVLGEVYVGSTYKVTPKSKLADMAYDRVKEKTSLFGRNAIKVVTEFFAKEGMDRAAIMRYCAYALRPDGPGLFSHPAAEFSSQGDDDYTVRNYGFVSHTADHAYPVAGT